MSLLHGKITRRILPRWRNSQRAASNADFQSLKMPKSAKANIASELREQTQDFAQTPNIGTAAELLTTALLAGKPEDATPAASFVLENQDSAPSILLQLARSIAEGSEAFRSSASVSGRDVAKTRQLLRVEPNNPVLWSDMARHFASLGDRRQALRCMKTALNLAPNHRWMLRTAARFLVYQEDPVAAHKLLTSHPRTRHDPWLIAAELACAQVAGRTPKYWRQATDILRFDSVAPLHMSELATAVAMMELEAGERKRARKFIQKGLIAPTENTLAQVFWAKENRHLNDGFRLDELVRSATDAYEADYQMNLLRGNLLDARSAAATWGCDEPFAARPCAELAYVACLLDDHETTILMAGKVKQLDGRSNPTLELNAAFAKLSSGLLNPQKNATEIARIKTRLLSVMETAGDDSYHAVANLGLWFYRFGFPLLGRETYQQAIAIAQKAHLSEAAALAATFAAREAILAHDPTSFSILEQAKALVAKSKHKPAEFYLRKLDALAVAPDKASEILCPSSAERFLAHTKSEAKPFRFEHTKDGPVLWIKKR